MRVSPRPMAQRRAAILLDLPIHHICSHSNLTRLTRHRLRMVSRKHALVVLITIVTRNPPHTEIYPLLQWPRDILRNRHRHHTTSNIHVLPVPRNHTAQRQLALRRVQYKFLRRASNMSITTAVSCPAPSRLVLPTTAQPRMPTTTPTIRS